jgi:hypothetical protein
MADRLDVQTLITFLAETGADPQWVAEAIAIEQELLREARAGKAAAAGGLFDHGDTVLEPPRGQLVRLRPQLRVVAAAPE